MGISNSQLGIFYPIGDLFSDSALPDSEITNPRLGILSPTGELISPIGDNKANWGYFLLVVYWVHCQNIFLAQNLQLKYTDSVTSYSTYY